MGDRRPAEGEASIHATVLIGIVLALGCAVGTNVGGLLKQKGAVAAPPVDIRHPWRTTVALFRSKWWTIGWIVAAVGWGLHVAALGLAPLSLAQAVISGGLVLLGIIAERWFGFKLTRRQWVGLALVAVGMTFLAVTAKGNSSHSNYTVPALVGFEAGTIALGVLLVAGDRTDGVLENRPGVLLGAAAGLLFGVSDISIKAITGEGGGAAMVLSPWTATALIAGVGGFFSSARSLQVGDGVAVITATAATANVAGIAGGVVVFGDPLGNTALSMSGRVLAFVLVVVAASLMPAPVRAHEAVAGD